MTEGVIGAACGYGVGAAIAFRPAMQHIGNAIGCAYFLPLLALTDAVYRKEEFVHEMVVTALTEAAIGVGIAGFAVTVCASCGVLAEKTTRYVYERFAGNQQ